MKTYTTAELAPLINKSLPHTKKLVRDGVIKAVKLNPGVKNSPYVITEKALQRYLNNIAKSA